MLVSPRVPVTRWPLALDSKACPGKMNMLWMSFEPNDFRWSAEPFPMRRWSRTSRNRRWDLRGHPFQLPISDKGSVRRHPWRLISPLLESFKRRGAELFKQQLPCWSTALLGSFFLMWPYFAVSCSFSSLVSIWRYRAFKKISHFKEKSWTLLGH